MKSTTRTRLALAALSLIGWTLLAGCGPKLKEPPTQENNPQMQQMRQNKKGD